MDSASTPAGGVSQDGLTILNPEGFNSEYLLKAGKMILDVDMKTLLTSRGKTLELEEAVGGKKLGKR